MCKSWLVDLELIPRGGPDIPIICGVRMASPTAPRASMPSSDYTYSWGSGWGGKGMTGVTWGPMGTKGGVHWGLQEILRSPQGGTKDDSVVWWRRKRSTPRKKGWAYIGCRVGSSEIGWSSPRLTSQTPKPLIGTLTISVLSKSTRAESPATTMWRLRASSDHV